MQLWGIRRECAGLLRRHALLRRETYLELCRAMRAPQCLYHPQRPGGVYLPYGRILRTRRAIHRHGGGKGRTAEQKRITELNSGVYVFDARALKGVLGLLRSDNRPGGVLSH
jgi:bifunctional N-acetylglucosamine-1-phosphate-uridyltransferase/glucosamine-1-phosphate-acetyltransferase GlmU-like protein